MSQRLTTTEFRETLDSLTATNSRKEKRSIIEEMYERDGGWRALTILTGEQFDDIGIGKQTVISAAEEAFDTSIEGRPTVTEEIAGLDTDGVDEDVYWLFSQMKALRDVSGNEQHEQLVGLFEHMRQPSVLSYAILTDLATGVGESTVANALGLEDSLPFYESVAEAAFENRPRTEPKTHEPFDPMLAVPESRGRPEGETVAQTKVDGYRLILHVTSHEDGQRVTAFSRRGNDVTESLPELQEIVFPTGEFIIDGEVLAETGSYADTSSRVGRSAENVERDTEMVFYAFDLIRAEGFGVENEDIHEKPFRHRYGALLAIEQLVGDKHLHVLGIEPDVSAALDEAADEGHEGIIVKNLSHSYQFGNRSADWQKVKLDDECVDVVITNVVEGEGRLSGSMGKVGLASADGEFLGYCGSGWSDEERADVWENQEEWVGAVIEVEARGLGTGDNLRMPIFSRVRSDDGQADSFERVSELMKQV